jgi:hypothetical protein
MILTLNAPALLRHPYTYSEAMESKTARPIGRAVEVSR